jgi:hypothetical protein
VLAPRPLRHVDLPFPPFMMTQICEPTHLSMSSGRGQWARMLARRQCTYRGAEGFRETWCRYNGDGQTDAQASDSEVQSRVELVRHVCLAPHSKSASQSPHATYVLRPAPASVQLQADAPSPKAFPSARRLLPSQSATMEGDALHKTRLLTKRVRCSSTRSP